MHQCRIRVRAETEPAGYFKTTRHAAAATPELLYGTAHPSTKTQVPQQKIDENGGLMEYSVVYTDRAMNHMSAPFQEVMNCVEINFGHPTSCET